MFTSRVIEWNPAKVAKTFSTKECTASFQLAGSGLEVCPARGMATLASNRQRIAACTQGRSRRQERIRICNSPFNFASVHLSTPIEPCFCVMVPKAAQDAPAGWLGCGGSQATRKGFAGVTPCTGRFFRASARRNAERPAGKLYGFPAAEGAGAGSSPGSVAPLFVTERSTSFVKKNFPSLGTSMI